MRIQSTRFLPLAVAIVAASPLIAADPAVPVAPSQFTFLAYIPGDCDNLFVFGDILPPVRRMLGSDAFRRFAAESHMAQVMSRDGTDMTQALGKLEANSQFVPTEVVIGFPSATYDDFVNLTKLALAVALCNGATRTGDTAIQDDLSALQGIVLETALALKAPRLTIWVRFRDPQIANTLFGFVASGARRIAERAGIEVSVAGETVHLKCLLEKVLPAPVFSALLTQYGVVATPDDPKLGEIASALAKLEAEVWVERVSDGIRLTLGPQLPQRVSYPTEHLGPLWRTDPPLLVFGKWQLGDLKASTGAVVNLWQNYRDTEIGQAVRSLDDDDTLGGMMLLADQIRRASSSATFQVTAGDSLDMIMHEQGFATIESLATSPLIKFLPRDAEIIMVDARQSLADHLVGTLSKFEDRLAKRQLQDDLGGRKEQAAAVQAISDAFYQRLAGFRLTIYEEGPGVFAPPFAMLVSSRGKIDGLELRFDNSAGENSVTVKDAPFVEYAAIGRLADPSRPPTFFNNAARAFFGGFVSDVPEAIFVPRDLDLGVETLAFRSDAFAHPPHNVSISVVGDLDPHYFVIDGWVVASTSVRLSKSILAASRDPTQRFTLPKHGDASLTAIGLMPGETLARSFEGIWKLIADFTCKDGSVVLAGPISAVENEGKPLPLDGGIAISEAIRLLDHAAWTTIDGKNVRVTRFSINFAALPQRR
jgi:hypothetical protein